MWRCIRGVLKESFFASLTLSSNEERKIIGPVKLVLVLKLWLCSKFVLYGNGGALFLHAVSNSPAFHADISKGDWVAAKPSSVSIAFLHLAFVLLRCLTAFDHFRAICRRRSFTSRMYR